MLSFDGKVLKTTEIFLSKPVVVFFWQRESPNPNTISKILKQPQLKSTQLKKPLWVKFKKKIKKTSQIYQEKIQDLNPLKMRGRDQEVQKIETG